MWKKYLFLSLIILLLGSLPFILKDPLPSSDKKKITWLTPDEIKQAEKDFKRERRKKGYKKADGPDQYMHFHYAIRTREDEEGPTYATNYRLEELSKAKENLQIQDKRLTMLEWKERGPANVPGRTRAILVDPRDANQLTWFAGAIGGGIWKTTNGGESWQIITPDLPNMAISALSQSKSHPDIIYAGTGEGFFNFDAINGDGMFKSIDGGINWVQLTNTANNINFQNINRIIVDPLNPNIVLVCSNTGRFNASFNSAIMKSMDGGITWKKVYTGLNRVLQLLDDPSDFMIQYATVYNRGILKSTDGGETWLESDSGIQPLGRIEMAVSPVDPQMIYAAVEGKISGTTIDLYVSMDGAKSWHIVLEADNGKNVNWTGSQGWYNNSIAAHPFDKNIVYVGGIDLWKMELKDEIEEKPIKAESYNTSSFLEYINFGGLFMNGGVTTGDDWFKDYPEFPKGLNGNEHVAIELRFGTGKSQKAHRFLVPKDKGSGVLPTEYAYADYVDVPFEVWDIKNNQQLMVSFRDQDRNGSFNLEPYDPNYPLNSREYIFIHAEPYNHNNYNGEIAKTAGIAYRTIYSLWPALVSGSIWSPQSLPESKLSIITSPTRAKITTNLTDMYLEHGGKNSNVHVDHHLILPVISDQSKKSFKILNGNDGGVYVSDPGVDPGVTNGSWRMAGNLYNTSQLYGVDKKRGADEYIGGAQDNGTWRSTSNVTASNSTNYVYQIGGDGFEVVWNYADTKKIIGSAQFNNFWRTLDGGNRWRRATTGLTDVETSNAPFFSKIENSKSNPDVLFTIGASGVWRSDDFGGSWLLTPINSSWTFGSFTSVRISLSNNKIVWAGGAISSTGKLHVSTNGGQSFEMTNGYGSPMGSISGLATHPTQDSTAFALFSFARSPKILRTTDLGKSWHDITGFSGTNVSANGFPNVAVYSLFVFPNEPNRIWVGTEIGIVESVDNGNSWYLANNGLPNTAVWQMKLVDNQIVVATHGRGIWTAEVAVEIPTFFAPCIAKAGLSPNGEMVLEVNLQSAYDSLIVTADDVPIFTTRNVSGTNKIIKFEPPPPTNQLINIAIDAYVGHEMIRSNYARPYNYQLLDAGIAYSNDFNDQPQDDFIGNGFEIKMMNNFVDRAIHSPHDYEDNQEYVYYLKKPIIIEDRDAIFSYSDIALVEPGEKSIAYGAESFYDYVVVEGTKDGLNWLPIKYGYDANYDKKWLSAYQNNQPGSHSLYINQTVNLLNTFSAKDTVLFRFKLFSDSGETGWGWAIDNLKIQSDRIMAVNGNSEAILSLQCYPVPVVGKATIAYSLPTPMNAKIELVNIAGKIMDQYFIHEKDGATGEISWIPPASGIYIVRLQTPLGSRSEKILVR